jgi:calcineurin-like phosphoesterase family protein
MTNFKQLSSLKNVKKIEKDKDLIYHLGQVFTALNRLHWSEKQMHSISWQ